MLSTNLSAQGIYATLTGLVTDQSQAVVAQGKVTLKDAQSGSQRETVTNSDGYFTFASVPVGNYELTIEAKGFQQYKVNGIALNGGDKRNVDAQLTVGATTQSVEITGAADAIAPVDSGEKTNLVTTKELQNFVAVGSNAAEFIKIMPGFGIQNGTSNKSNFSGETIGINGNGDGGNQSPLNNAFSYNGLPTNSLDITADGAHVSDPGCNCATPVNPNSDMISELQVKTSNFSAENQKGPAVITSVAKSGGKDFHGSAFFYARNYAMNANDALLNSSGLTRPENKYYYPGFTIGGPVLIPGTNFNKNRNKLFFFTGFEYFYQVLDTGLLRATVPTAGEIGGNFTAAEVAKEGNITASGGAPGQLNAAALALFPGGVMPANLIDKNMQALMRLYPAANADPNATGGFNYVQAETFNQNNTQWMSRVDYSISDNTKLFVRYNLQRETQQFPVGLWWRQTDQVPYPTPVEGKNKSDSVTASLTHVFSPTMTNEFVFAYTYIGFPNVFQDPSKVDRTKVGYGYAGIFKNGVAQIPSFGGLGWTNQEAAVVFNPGGFEAGGPTAGLYADKWLPSLSDTVTKVVGKHTVKAGFFYEWIRNSQPANNSTNGQLQVWNGNSNTFGNEYADLLYGNLNGYSESSFNRINDIAYGQYEGFVQDSWKVSRRLTLELGIRLTHFQPWVDRTGAGYSIFDYSQYKSTCAPTDYCGFEWHKRNSNVPLGGFPTRALFYQPRFGVAYDLTGEGKTVLRGGWGRYYYHSGQFTNGLDVAAGVQSVSLPNNINGQPLLARNLSSINIAAQALSPAAVDSKDDRQPYTDSWNFTISQRTPWSGMAEFSYVGNQSRDLALSSGAGSNINLVPVGSMLASRNGGADPNSLNANDFRPLLGFSDLNLATNKAYSNYNALQVTWVRTKGRYTINMNYTFGKAMGIVSTTLDQFNLNNDYGVQSTNRTHIFNAAYSVELGTPIKHNKALGGAVNGWQLSGILQLESGPNLSGIQGEAFGMNLNGAQLPGTAINISNVSLLGTPNIQLNPVLTCNPSSNLAANQYINPSCFSFPKAVGQNGPSVLPAIYGPAFFNSDLGMFKNFNITESKKLQFRFNAYNFLNHPLWSFNGSNLSLGFDPASGKVNTPLFGTVTEKQGHRVVQAAVKFYF
ncbi:MAG TPA: carboxypeptidase-like regulatory domain-containing protein [Candidatus Sulfopaludibacter sp.]|nr:carboxypeptidase-like regulatory domain-containing protein [Candidatus Sulfopaludibacter sp.]